jgi:hypothetical protein
LKGDRHLQLGSKDWGRPYPVSFLPLVKELRE